MKLKKYAFIGVEILKARLLNKRTPLVVFFSVTDRCNFRCEYCEIWKRNGQELSTKKIFTIINELSMMGTKGISFCGGEPLMREDIGEIIDYSKNRGLDVGMGSNGYLVSERIKEIKNLDTIQFGFDGPKRIHDKQRQKGSYEKLMEGIKIVNKYKIKVFTTTVLTKDNINQIDFILRKAEELGFRALFQPVMSYPRPFSGCKTLSLSSSRKEYRGAIKTLMKKKRTTKLIGNSKSSLKYFYDWPNHNKNIKCWAGRLTCAISTNGNVYSCLDMQGKEKPLNCTEVGFKKAFQSLQKVRCDGCWSYGHTEFNLLFSLNPEVIYNALKI